MPFGPLAVDTKKVKQSFASNPKWVVSTGERSPLAKTAYAFNPNGWPIKQEMSARFPQITLDTEKLYAETIKEKTWLKWQELIDEVSAYVNHKHPLPQKIWESIARRVWESIRDVMPSFIKSRMDRSYEKEQDKIDKWPWKIEKTVQTTIAWPALAVSTVPWDVLSTVWLWETKLADFVNRIPDDLRSKIEQWWLNESVISIWELATDLWMSVAAWKALLSSINSIPALSKFLNVPKNAWAFVKASKWALKNILEWVGITQAMATTHEWRLAKPWELALWAAADVALSTVWPLLKRWANDIRRMIKPTVKDVSELIQKSVKPTVIGKSWSIKWLKEFEDNVLWSVETIIRNKKPLKFIDPETLDEVVGQSPKNLRQFAEAISQTKNSIYSKYAAKAEQAWLEWARVDLWWTIEELENAMKAKTIEISNPWIKQYIQSQIDTLKDIWSFDVQEAQDLLKQLNSKLESFYKNPNPNDVGKSVVDASIANNIRSKLNSSIEEVLWWSTEYADLKKAYGELTSIEKEVNKRAIVDARQNAKSLIDYTDIFSAWDIVNWLATMNPWLVAKWWVQAILKSIYKSLNDPNKNIKRLFDVVWWVIEKWWSLATKAK